MLSTSAHIPREITILRGVVQKKRCGISQFLDNSQVWKPPQKRAIFNNTSDDDVTIAITQSCC